MTSKGVSGLVAAGAPPTGHTVYVSKSSSVIQAPGIRVQRRGRDRAGGFVFKELSTNFVFLVPSLPVFSDKDRTDVLGHLPAGHGLERGRRQLLGRGCGVQKAPRHVDATPLLPQDPQGDQRTGHVR